VPPVKPGRRCVRHGRCEGERLNHPALGASEAAGQRLLMNGVSPAAAETSREERSIAAEGRLTRRSMKWNAIGKRRTSEGS